MNTAYKLYTRIINNRLKNIADALLPEEQCGFRKGRSYSDNVTIMRQLVEKGRKFKLETHIAIIDYEKTVDRVNGDILWKILEQRGYPHHIRSIKKPK